MTFVNGMEVPCLFCTHDRQLSDLRKTPDFRNLEISVGQLSMFDHSRAVRRTELELSRIRQFAGEAGVSIPHHFWDVLYRVLVVRFSWPCLECRDCEEWESKTFIMSVIALAFFNPGRDDSLLVNGTRTGWINQTAAHLLDEKNRGVTPRPTACDFISDLFVAADEMEKYRRPMFVRSLSFGCRFSSNYDIVINQAVNGRFVHLRQRTARDDDRIRVAFLSQSNEIRDFLLLKSNVLTLNIPEDEKLPTEVLPRVHLHSLKELSLKSIVAAVIDREPCPHLSLARRFKGEISAFFERLSRPSDGGSLASDLKQLSRVLEEFRGSVQTCSLPKLPLLKLHAFIRSVVESRCCNVIQTVELLLRNSDLSAHGVLEELRRGSSALSLCADSKDPSLEETTNQLAARLVSDLKALQSVLQSVDASETTQIEPHLMCQKEMSLRTLTSVRSTLEQIGARCRLNNQPGDFPYDAVHIIHSFCCRLSQDLCALWNKSFGFHWIYVFIPILQETVNKLDEFNPSQVAADQLNRFLVARFLEDVALVETFSEHIGAVNDFAVSFAKVRFLVNRELYTRNCLEQMIPDEIDSECVLLGVNISAVC